MAKENRGFSVRIFIPSGEPEGLRLVEKSNWTGQGVVFPRSLFKEAREREELKRTGVYILWGPSDSGLLPRAYVGEGDGVLARLDQHAKNKDFWTHAVVFTSKDQNLNKAHVQYIESRLISLASDAKRCELDNSNAPQLSKLSDADTADAESFLADMLLCLPVVGVSLFEKSKAAHTKDHDLILKSKGIEARGIDSAEGFIVRKGSTAVKATAPSLQTNTVELRQALINNGVLTDAGETYRLIQDYTFNSPSAATTVLLGMPSNGRIMWKDASGRTLKEIQEAGSSEI